MNDPSLPIQGAIFRTLKDNDAVSQIVANRVFDGVPKDAAFPYISIGETGVSADRADCMDAATSFPVVHAWSRGIGGTEAKLLGAAIIAALDGVEIEIPGHRMLSIQVESARYMRDDDGLTSHAVIAFEAVTESID